MHNFLILLFCLFLCPLFSQHLHTPTELFLLMEKSSIQYELDSVSLSYSPPVFTLLQEGWTKELESGALQTPKANLVTDVSAEKYRKKADKFFSRQQFNQAARFYAKAIAREKQPNNAFLQKQLCRSYLKMGKKLDAGKALQPLMELHQPDFMLHRLLAEIYQLGEQNDLAIYHITLAHLLNRNEQTTLDLMIQIYQKNGLTFKKWNFQPQYKLEKTANGIKVYFLETPWRAYASCRAVWQHEPEYAQNMDRLSSQPVATIEQKECLLNALIAFEKQVDNKEKFPEFQALAKALPNNEINSFILYEITSREDPLSICQLEETDLKELVGFVREYHCN